jgi:hypothetical protein
MAIYVMERKKSHVFDRILKFSPTTIFVGVMGLHPDSAGQLKGTVV